MDIGQVICRACVVLLEVTGDAVVVGVVPRPSCAKRQDEAAVWMWSAESLRSCLFSCSYWTQKQLNPNSVIFVVAERTLFRRVRKTVLESWDQRQPPLWLIGN